MTKIIGNNLRPMMQLFKKTCVISLSDKLIIIKYKYGTNMFTLRELLKFKRSVHKKEHKKIHHKFYQSLLIVSMLLFTSSCTSWLQPALEQEIVGIKAGEYSLDNDHAALLFK